MRNIRSTALRLATLAFIIGLLLGLFAPKLFATDAPGAPLQAHVVAGGETLWSLGRDLRPEMDRREFVFEVQRLNGLENVIVHPGQRLLLPPR